MSKYFQVIYTFIATGYCSSNSRLMLASIHSSTYIFYIHAICPIFGPGHISLPTARFVVWWCEPWGLTQPVLPAVKFPSTHFWLVSTDLSSTESWAIQNQLCIIISEVLLPQIYCQFFLYLKENQNQSWWNQEWWYFYNTFDTLFW